MSNYRATKSGVALDNQQKMAAKYDAELASKCMCWIRDLLEQNNDKTVVETSGAQADVVRQLKDGIILSKVANILQSAQGNNSNLISAAKINKPSTMPFKQMEMIGLAIDSFKKFGLPEHENFQTVDLYEEQNMYQVICCLQSLARKAKALDLVGFGPKESEANRRDFTEEQMKAGQSVISLQMGSNKGASQAGMNIGKSRHIVD